MPYLGVLPPLTRGRLPTRERGENEVLAKTNRLCGCTPLNSYQYFLLPSQREVRTTPRIAAEWLIFCYPSTPRSCPEGSLRLRSRPNHRLGKTGENPFADWRRLSILSIENNRDVNPSSLTQDRKDSLVSGLLAIENSQQIVHCSNWLSINGHDKVSGGTVNHS